MKIFSSPPSLRHSRDNAFTGLEIILTVALIALLAVSAIYLMREGERTCVPIPRPYLCKADIEGLKTQLQLYQTRHGHLPTTAQGLKALVHCPATDPQPSHWRQLLPEMPMDPWGTEYQLRNPAIKSTQDPFDLFSAGKDRQPGTADDIGNCSGTLRTPVALGAQLPLALANGCSGPPRSGNGLTIRRHICSK